MATVSSTNRFWTSPVPDDVDADAAVLAKAARSMIVARRALQASLPIDFLHDPALDILLTLFVAAIEGHSAHPAAIAAATTITAGVAQRWIAALVQEGLIVAAPDAIEFTEHGRRRVEEAIRMVVRSQIGLHGSAEDDTAGTGCHSTQSSPMSR